MNLATVQKIYVIGLGGIGVSAVANYFLAQGKTVVGSDATPSPVIDDVVRRGGQYLGLDNQPARLQTGYDLVVYSDACSPDHPEVAAARLAGLPTLSFAEALGQIMSMYPRRVAVAGTNGKSTTTALGGLLMADAGLDPTVFVGSRVDAFSGNLRLGKSDIVLSEADEYRNHFHHLHPTVLTITNIELDHTDFFQNLDQIVDSFMTVITAMPQDSLLILNADDKLLLGNWSQYPSAITYGQTPDADLQWEVTKQKPGQQLFRARWRGTDLGAFILHVPGQFNLANAAAAMTTALAMGASPQTFQKTLDTFRGIWRRFEIMADSQITVISDYGHHPTAIAGTVAGARAFYPGRRIVLVFQPHHHHRLTALFDQFVSALAAADMTIISEVYAVLGRENIQGMKTSHDLVAAIEHQEKKDVYYAATPAAAEALVDDHIQAGDVLIIMGAGDIWTIAEPLAKRHGH